MRSINGTTTWKTDSEGAASLEKLSKKFLKNCQDSGIMVIFTYNLKTKDMSKIREMIAESGKMKVTDAVAYVMRNMPEADKKEVTREAKEMIADAKKFNR
jgi:hypothetical protein